jgi:hypothetical protein
MGSVCTECFGIGLAQERNQCFLEQEAVVGLKSGGDAGHGELRGQVWLLEGCEV